MVVFSPVDEDTTRLLGKIFANQQRQLLEAGNGRRRSRRPEKERSTRTMESDACEGQPEHHARRRDQHDSSAADDINVFQRKQREDEVGPGYNQADCRRLIEANLLEQSCGVVHQRVEAG